MREYWDGTDSPRKGWMPESDMKVIHKIRQDYAKARMTHEQYPAEGTQEALDEAVARRDRAIRTVHEEDGATVPKLAAMFRCSKTVIRTALQGVAA